MPSKIPIEEAPTQDIGYVIEESGIARSSEPGSGRR